MTPENVRRRPRVLVTGAAGYTGLALACHLMAGGAGVRALVRRPSQSHELQNAGADVLPGDVRDRSTIEEALDGVDTLYHLAAVFRKAGVPDSEYRSVHVDA